MEKLYHHAGQIIEFVGARGSSLVECLDNISCHVLDIVDFGIHRGAVVVLLIRELQPGYSLWDIFVQWVENILKGYDEVAHLQHLVTT